MRTNNLYKVTDSRQAGKVVIRFSNCMNSRQVKTFLYEERQVTSCYILRKVLGATDEAEAFEYKEVKLSSVANFLERHFQSIQAGRKEEQQEEARKAEAEARKQEAEAEEQNYYYSSLSEYIAKARTEKEVYTPIHKMMTAYARNFYHNSKYAAVKHGQQAKQTDTTKEGVKVYEGGTTDKQYNRYYADYMKLSGNGFLIRTEAFDSYANNIYCVLSSMNSTAEAVNTSWSDDCIYYDSFKTALKLATDKGIYYNYHSLHGGRIKQQTAEAVTFDSFTTATQEQLINYHDRYNTEATALKTARAQEAIETMTARQAKAVKLFAVGFSYHEIALYMDSTEEAVKQLIKFARNRAFIAEQEAESMVVKKTALKPCRQFSSFPWNRQADKEGYSFYLKQAEADSNRRLSAWYEAKEA